MLNDGNRPHIEFRMVYRFKWYVICSNVVERLTLDCHRTTDLTRSNRVFRTVLNMNREGDPSLYRRPTTSAGFWIRDSDVDACCVIPHCMLRQSLAQPALRRTLEICHQDYGVPYRVCSACQNSFFNKAIDDGFFIYFCGLNFRCSVDTA